MPQPGAALENKKRHHYKVANYADYGSHMPYLVVAKISQGWIGPSKA